GFEPPHEHSRRHPRLQPPGLGSTGREGQLLDVAGRPRGHRAGPARRLVDRPDAHQARAPDWFPPVAGLEVLCLASGGGQQGPILAAAGARVTVFDNSPNQLAQDRLVADREGLALETVRGDMADLAAFPDARFDLIVHPCSNMFVPDVRPVWREAFRVLR